MKYKFLTIKNKQLKSYNGDHTWEVGKWYHSDEIDICNKGFHCSKEPLDALSYVQGDVVALVKTKGKSDIQDDKEVWSDMRIVKAYHWTKKDSVALAIFSAELVIDLYEKEYPNDDRPRKAIEAAKKVLKDDTTKNRKAAAWAARAAARAAETAAWAAVRAAWAAVRAAWAAARAARAAARAAVRAAWAAAATDHKKTLKKINSWMKKRIKTLEPYE